MSRGAGHGGPDSQGSRPRLSSAARIESRLDRAHRRARVSSPVDPSGLDACAMSCGAACRTTLPLGDRRLAAQCSVDHGVRCRGRIAVEAHEDARRARRGRSPRPRQLDVAAGSTLASSMSPTSVGQHRQLHDRAAARSTRAVRARVQASRFRVARTGSRSRRPGAAQQIAPRPATMLIRRRVAWSRSGSSRRCGGDASSIVDGVSGDARRAASSQVRRRRRASPAMRPACDDAGGSGDSLNVALVITARLPSDPHISCDRS